MESGDGVRVTAAIPEERGRLASRPYKSVNLLSSLMFDYSGERSGTRGFQDNGKMEIIQFSVNIDKFTGFFDKYLKTNGVGAEPITNIISVSYKDRFKQKMNVLSKFIE